MKILHVIDSAGLYGAEVMLLNLMDEHRQMGMKPVLASIEDDNSSQEPSLHKEAVRRGLSSVRLELKRGFSIANALKIVRLAKEEQVDIIHSHGYKGNILLGSLPRKLRGMPVISTVHGWTATDKFSRIWLYSRLDKFFLGKMDAIVTVNSSVCDIGATHRYNVVNGIPPLSFAPRSVIMNDGEISEFCSESFIIGTLCRLSDEKGLPYLLEAMQILTDKTPCFKTVIIGEGPQRGVLEDMIKKKGLGGKVLLAGYRDKAYNYLPLFNIFVLPSLTEGLPITILEAMHAEVPIVATSVGGIPEVLELGRLGILVEPANPKSLADAIYSAWEDPARAADMAHNAKTTALQKYSSRSMAENYLNVYESVLRGWSR